MKQRAASALLPERPGETWTMGLSNPAQLKANSVIDREMKHAYSTFQRILDEDLFATQVVLSMLHPSVGVLTVLSASVLAQPSDFLFLFSTQ